MLCAEKEITCATTHVFKVKTLLYHFLTEQSKTCSKVSSKDSSTATRCYHRKMEVTHLEMCESDKNNT